MATNISNVEILIDNIDKLRDFEMIKKTEDLQKAVDHVKKYTQMYNQLSSEGKRGITNKAKLQQSISFIKNREKMEALESRLLKIDNEQPSPESPKRGFRELKEELKTEQTQQNKKAQQHIVKETESDENVEQWVIKNNPPKKAIKVEPINAVKQGLKQEEIHSDYVNPQLAQVKKIYLNQRRELNDDEKAQKEVKFKAHTDVVKSNIESLIVTYRDNVNIEKDTQDEATQSGLEYYPDDIDNMPGEDGDSAILYDFNVPDQTKKTTRIEKIKTEKTKKARWFKTKKKAIKMANEHGYDGYYENVPTEDEAIEKKKLDAATSIKVLFVGLFVVACMGATIYMFFQF